MQLGNNGKYILLPSMRRLNGAKMLLLPKFIDKFNVIPLKVSR